MKRYIYFFFILTSLISVIWFMQLSKAQYKERSQLNLSISSTPLYFDHTGTDMTIPYNNNTANIDLTLHNYVDQNYTIENIKYTISIDNKNYTFSADGTDATNNKLSLVLDGGARNSSTLHIIFNRLDTTNVPAKETVTVTISANYPYTFTKSFVVTITNEGIDVTGNPINWTKDDVTLTIVPKTEELQLSEYSFDGGQTWSTNPSKTYEQNTNNITIYAKDSDGQIVGPLVVDITKIDKTPPEFTIADSIEYNADGSEKTVKTLITRVDNPVDILTGMNAVDTQSGISATGITCTRNGQTITSTSAFTQVGRYKVTYTVSDEVGNTSTIDREILIRWPLAGKYVLARQTPVGTGLSSSTGLWEDNADTGKDTSLPFASKYFYSGKNVDNYVTFPNTSRDKSSATTWRIINIPENDCVKITHSDGLSDRYNINDSSSEQGDFYKTTLYSKLVNWASSGLVGDSNNDFNIDFSDSGHIATATFYVGGVDRPVIAGNSSTLKEINWERTQNKLLGGSSAAWESKLALPTVSDYIKSCSSTKVYNIRSQQQNQSVFSDTAWMYHSDRNEWSMTGCSAKSGQYWRLNNKEFLSRPSTNSWPGYLRPTVYLKNDTILSGTGSSSDPFVVQENWAWFDSYQPLQ